MSCNDLVKNKKDFSACNKDLASMNNKKSPKYLNGSFSCNNSNSAVNPCPKLCYLSNSNFSNLHVWHKRLAYTSFTTLQHVKFPDISLLLNSKEKGEVQLCDICHKAKQTILPFPTHIRNTTAAFELIHMDIWGPYSQPSLTGTSYMLTLVDDFSRATKGPDYYCFYILHSDGTNAI